MITCIWGLTGSCKSWLLARILYAEWKAGYNISTVNIPLYFSDQNERISQFWLLSDTYHLSNGVIGIDEAQKILSADNWHSLPPLFKDLICQHRHSGLDIFCCTQTIKQIDVFVRRNIHEGYACQTIFRFPRNERIKPILQCSRVQKKIRIIDEKDNVTFVNSGRARWYFISRLWTKKLYDTYSATRLSRYVTETVFEKNEWVTKIINRELIASGAKRPLR